MNKKLFSKLAVGTITAALTVISGVVTLGYIHYAKDEAERKIVKKASETPMDESETPTDNEEEKTE